MLSNRHESHDMRNPVDSSPQMLTSSSPDYTQIGIIEMRRWLIGTRFGKIGPRIESKMS
mgnify:CR=1 FL=1